MVHLHPWQSPVQAFPHPGFTPYGVTVPPLPPGRAVIHHRTAPVHFPPPPATVPRGLSLESTGTQPLSRDCMRSMHAPPLSLDDCTHYLPLGLQSHVASRIKASLPHRRECVERFRRKKTQTFATAPRPRYDGRRLCVEPRTRARGRCARRRGTSSEEQQSAELEPPGGAAAVTAGLATAPAHSPPT